MVHYTAQITEREACLFEPFLNRLVDRAFSVIVPKFLTGIHVDDKSNGTPVTQADKGAELALREEIEGTWPDHGIFGEEFGIVEGKGDWPRYRWILDPIDGTRAFIANSFHFGTLIALEREDAPGDGFCPILSAIGFAAAGVRAIGSLRGAKLIVESQGQKISRPMSVRECACIEEVTLLATSHWTTTEQVGDSRLQHLIDRAKLYRTWGDCFGYFAVASGGADIMIDPDLSYWDVAALLPVVEGAGGRLTSISGGNPLKELSALASAGGTVHDEVLRVLNA